jgi:energy-coupling factor transporter ATP-binding protein EcfA2
MRLTLREATVCRGDFCLQASAMFFPGIHLVHGPIGCGKTTLALLLAGILSVQGGEIQKEGIHRTGLLMQFPEYQVTSRTVEQEVESWGAPAEPVLRSLHLSDLGETDPLTLSRGELKRLLFTTLLYTAPDLVLLDEPFGGMDCRERKRMVDALSESTTRITILFSHEQSRLPKPDYLWEIREGVLQAVTHNTPDTLKRTGETS